MSKELSFIGFTIILFLVAAFLTAPESIVRWVTQNITWTGILIAVLLYYLTVHKPILGNPFMKLISIVGGILAFAALFAIFLSFRIDAQKQVQDRMCLSDTSFGQLVHDYVCQPLGLATAPQPNAQYSLVCLTRAFNNNLDEVANLGCERYTPEVQNDAARYKAYEDCLANSIIDGMGKDGTDLVQSCRRK